MEKLVDEIGKLLDPKDTSKASDFVLLKDFVQNGVVKGDLSTLRENLTQAYATEAIVPEDENLYPLETPNSLYYAWALANGYLPQ